MTEDSLRNTQIVLESSISSPTTADTLANNTNTARQGNQSVKPDPSKKVDTAGNIAGYVATVTTSAVSAKATQVHQRTIKGPVDHAIERLEASKDPKQVENATTAEQITAGIVGAVKTFDNVAVGAIAGTFTGVVTSLSGPGAIVAGAAAGPALNSDFHQLIQSRTLQQMLSKNPLLAFKPPYLAQHNHELSLIRLAYKIGLFNYGLGYSR
jgi:hypothetical protein